jgi:(S)-sulfolactate dehydrogenase
MHIVIPEVMDANAVEWLKTRYEVHYEPTLVEHRPRMLDALANADAIIVKDRTQVDKTLLAAARRLRVVGRLGVGLDNIDLPACKERNIPVYPAVGANARSVAEYVICTALMLMRPGAYVCSAQVAAGEWPQKQVRSGREIDGKTMGIAGLGAIGQQVARLATGMGMRVIAWAPTKASDDKLFTKVGAQPVNLDALLAQSDIVSLHIPLTSDTRGVFNRERIFAMKKGALLINTARGALVDNGALVEALTSGHLGGAAVDVYDSEPLKAGSVFESVTSNLLLTPHIAGGTIESTERRGSVVAERVAAYLAQCQ